MNMLKLMYFEQSIHSQKIRAFAHYAGIELQEIPMQIKEQTHKSESFLALNPLGQVPVLLDGDFALSQSAAILTFLAKIAQREELLGRSVKDQAKLTQWLHWEAHTLQPVMPTINIEGYFKKAFKAISDEEVYQSALDDLSPLLQTMDKHLTGRTFFVGEDWTIVDFSIAGCFTHSKKAGVPLDSFPNFSNWLNRITQLDCWVSTQPQPL